MNKMLFALAAAVAALSGCASTQPAREIDSAYVNYVEKAARRYGATVIWLNYPVRRVETAAAEPAGK
jgi:outer membrane murein-binding lipoprotein Lpp